LHCAKLLLGGTAIGASIGGDGTVNIATAGNTGDSFSWCLGMVDW